MEGPQISRQPDQKTANHNSNEGQGTAEPKNTRSRNWLAARIKHVRRFPFEQVGKRVLPTRAANAVDMAEGNIGFSSLEFREVQMDVDFVREIKRILEKKREKGKQSEPATVLDVGAAQSTFLSQLKKRFGRQLEAHSLDIRFMDPEKFPQKRGIDQHVFHVEGMSKVLPPDYFDMVVDCRGGTLYAQDREKALDQIYAVLAPGASAYIFPKPRAGLKNIFNGEWIQKWAERNRAKAKLSWNKKLGQKVRAGRTLRITKPEQKVDV